MSHRLDQVPSLATFQRHLINNTHRETQCLVNPQHHGHRRHYVIFHLTSRAPCDPANPPQRKCTQIRPPISTAISCAMRGSAHISHPGNSSLTHLLCQASIRQPKALRHARFGSHRAIGPVRIEPSPTEATGIRPRILGLPGPLQHHHSDFPQSTQAGQVDLMMAGHMASPRRPACLNRSRRSLRSTLARSEHYPITAPPNAKPPRAQTPLRKPRTRTQTAAGRESTFLAKSHEGCLVSRCRRETREPPGRLL